ncbi:hypothetical protein AB4274_13660 [Vibrio sp. 10N.261.55.A10]|uniref:hypothetical protein n=1 Tax=Vibrio sp. 10N.261.55.A10 TaxID=3229687 RepID=UPI003550144B
MKNTHYYLDVDGQIYDAETCRFKQGMKTLTWEEAELYTTIPQERLEKERRWQKSELNKVERLVSDYKQDNDIPLIYSELRISSLTEGDYYSLLGDRKLLTEYLVQSDFPDCGRPILSGLTA